MINEIFKKEIQNKLKLVTIGTSLFVDENYAISKKKKMLIKIK